MNILHMFSAFPGYFIDKISKYISRSIQQQFIQHICDARSSKVAVNDHQINHKSSYSLLTITQPRVSVALHAIARVVTRHRSRASTNYTCHQQDSLELEICGQHLLLPTNLLENIFYKEKKNRILRKITISWF